MKFSPCADEELPRADALYLPGGYPELHAAQLAHNRSMRESVAQHVQDDKPVVAECGGLMYLARWLTDHQQARHPMVGALDVDVQMQPRLVAIGHYRWRDEEGEVRGHAFHHSALTARIQPVAHAEPQRRGRPEPVFRHRAVLASYLHWYFPSNPSRVAAWFRQGQGRERTD